MRTKRGRRFFTLLFATGITLSIPVKAETKENNEEKRSKIKITATGYGTKRIIFDYSSS